MAKALVDGDLAGNLITVDRTPADRAFEWPFVNENQENLTIKVSLNDFWIRYLPETLTERIEFRQGDTASVHKLLADQEHAPDLVIIDSDHTYSGVTLDFLSARAVSAPNAVFVFDDYSATSGYGIRKLVNEELSGVYSVKIIDMDLTAKHDISVDHMMAICNDEAVDVSVCFTAPSDLRFLYMRLKRWLRGELIQLAKMFGRR